MDQIGEALLTSAGILWKALWALIFGYVVSAGIQVLITREQMARALGERGIKKAGLASFFGFISSSCSFAALAAARSVLVKGAHPVNATAFLVASTNLVIELGIVLLVLLSWHFVVGNFALGILMIAYAYLLTRIWLPEGLAERARNHAEQQQEEEGMMHQAPEGMTWKEKLTSREGWKAISDAFFMEWKMAYKEILFGFTVAGFISVYVPQSFWNTLFLGAGSEAPSFVAVLENAAVAPVVAFFTFIGSMGNVPLAAMLWSKNASFGGVMAFLGADLVAATVIYLHAKYYGWRYAGYLSAVLYVSMVTAGITVHYLFGALGIIPMERPSLGEMVHFKIDHTFWFNLVFLTVGAGLLWLHFRGADMQRSRQGEHEQRKAGSGVHG